MKQTIDLFEILEKEGGAVSSILLFQIYVKSKLAFAAVLQQPLKGRL